MKFSSKCVKKGCPHTQCVLIVPAPQQSASQEMGNANAESNFWSVIVSPYPVYALLIFLFATEQGCDEHVNQIMISAIPLFAFVMELSNFFLFLPTRRMGTYGEEKLVDFEELRKRELKVKDMNDAQKIHACVTIFAIWTLAVTAVLSCTGRYWSFITSILLISIVLVLVSCRSIVREYLNNRWMTHCSPEIVKRSYCILLSGALFTVSGLVTLPYYDSASIFTQIGIFHILAAVLHLRFAYEFKNPPEQACMLTYKETRQMVKNYYGWQMMLIGSLVSFVTLKVIHSDTMSPCTNFMFAFLLLIAAVPITVLTFMFIFRMGQAFLCQKPLF